MPTPGSATSELREHEPEGSSADALDRITALERQVASLRSDRSDQERLVSFNLRNVLHVAMLGLLVAGALIFIYIAWAGIVLVLISLLVAIALDRPVHALTERGLKRPLSVGLVTLAAILAVAILAAAVIPPMVNEVSTFADQAPKLVDDAKAGKGPLGSLEKQFGLVTKAEDAVKKGGGGGVASSGLGVLAGVAGTFAGFVVITFLTLFMLLEGPRWTARLGELLPSDSKPRWDRIGRGVYRTVSGFVSGSLISAIGMGLAAGVVMTACGVEFAVPVALFVALLDLIPVLGPLIALVLVGVVALASQGLLIGLIVVGILFALHQLEVYVIKPLLFEQTIKLSPLVILIAVVIGTELAGVIGALAAIPIAGTVQVLVVEVAEARRDALRQSAADPEQDAGMLAQL